MNCILCDSNASVFFVDVPSQKRYLHCPQCDLRFLDPSQRLTGEEEHSRYLHHENDVTDPRYQDFVRPIYDLTIDEMPPTSIGLEYGCGAGPVLSHLLSSKGYTVHQYDPFFKPDPSYLERSYDFIVMTEVAEHFFYPAKEFSKLSGLLSKGGALGIMTLLYDSSINFSTWYYKKDPTHVCFYSAATFHWIAKNFNLKFSQQVGNRTVWLTKP